MPRLVAVPEEEEASGVLADWSGFGVAVRGISHSTTHYTVWCTRCDAALLSHPVNTRVMYAGYNEEGN